MLLLLLLLALLLALELPLLLFNLLLTAALLLLLRLLLLALLLQHLLLLLALLLAHQVLLLAFDLFPLHLQFTLAVTRLKTLLCLAGLLLAQHVRLMLVLAGALVAFPLVLAHPVGQRGGGGQRLHHGAALESRGHACRRWPHPLALGHHGHGTGAGLVVIPVGVVLGETRAVQARDVAGAGGEWWFPALAGCQGKPSGARR